MSKRIFLIIGVIILFIMIAMGTSTYTIIHPLIQREKETFKLRIENILKEVIINNIVQKCKDLPLSGLSNSPKKIRAYEARTFCSKDTLLVHQHKIQDIGTEVFFARQLGLLMMERLQSYDMEDLIVKHLNRNGTQGYVNTGVIVSKHLQRRIWSRPPSSIPHNSEKIIYHLEDEVISVDYTTYADYSFLTLWKRMPKTNIYINSIVELILIYIIILFIRYHRKYREETSIPAADAAEPAPHIIETMPVGSSVETGKQTSSTIKEELSLKDQFVFEENLVLFNSHPIKMPDQQQKILTFFLNSPNYRINKSDLKKES